jgi:hypothetical protein
MRGHVDAESLALCAEGLLGRRQSERIRAHVVLCPECTAEQARLSGVPALLAQVPPPSLPPMIAARLDAALNAEAARRAAPAPGRAPDYVPDRAAPARSPDAVPGPRAPRRRGLRLPVAARVLAVAGVLVVAGGVGYAVTQSSPSTSTSSASPPRAAASPSPRAVAGPNIGGPAFGTTFPVTHSGTSYQPHTFAAQALRVLAHPATGLMHPGNQSDQSGRSAPMLTGCVTRVVGAARAREVKLVDQARYGGRPATIIVVAVTPTQPGMVYVVGTPCSASDAPILARAPLR